MRMKRKRILFAIVTVLMAMSFAFAAAAASVGDMDQNGSLSAADARVILRASVGLENLSEEQKILADADFDGKISAADARLVLRASVGLEQIEDPGQSHTHEYETVVTKAPTCTKQGEQTTTCKLCSYKKVEILNATGHEKGEWIVILDSTVDKEGYERSQCKNCSYYTDRAVPKKEAAYVISVDTGVDSVSELRVAADGKYTLPVPNREGYIFKGWVDGEGNDFASSGVIKADAACTAVWELDGTDTLIKLVKRANAGTDKIVITDNITVNEPIYVPYETVIYSDGDFSITRAPDYTGDIFVVGSDKYGYPSVDKGEKAVLTLGGGEGTLTIDGNRDNITVDVNGSCIFVADSSELNLYDGVKIVNNYKTSNERINRYNIIMTEASRFRAGGAAIINITSTVNMYGGIIDNNETATEYTETDNGDGTVTKAEDNGCGGAVFNRGTFNMYGGVISNNTALRGGGIYNDKFCYLYSGEITGNLATVYGGALSSSSSSSADTFVGSRVATDKQMLIKDNRSYRAGGSMYSNTSSPIVIYSNAVFEGNRSDTSGGAVYTAGPLVIDGAKFINNTCEYSGGAIYHHYTKAEFKRKYIQLDNCTFDSNKAGLGGAVILSASGSVENEGTYAEITDCTFTKNEGIVTEINPGNGGALYITRNSDAVIKNCSFNENTSVKNAGAVAIHSGATVTMTDIVFNKNTAALGGAVYTSSDSVVTMKNVGFNENSAVMDENLSGGNGGAVYYAKANLTLNNVDFYNNTADNNAGAIYQNASTLKLDSTCDFIGNKAGNHGGALYLTYTSNEDGTKTGSVLNAQNVTFKNNSALAGGAVSGRTATDITLNKVKFIENSTPEAKVSTTTGGGAVYSNNSDVKITDTLFDGNFSGYYGGALRLDACVTTIKNTQVINSSGGTGGAIYASGETFDAQNLTLKGNSSTLNGVMYIANQEAVFTSLEATENTGVNGGVLYAGRKTQVEVTDSVLSSNTAKHGGVFYITAESDVTADNCEFSDNKAENGQGGAVYVSGASFDAVNGSSFTGNTATGHGGAISSQDVVSEVIPEPVPEDKPEDKPEDSSEDVIEPGSGDIPEDNPEDPDDFPEESTDEASEDSSEITPVLVNAAAEESTTAKTEESTTAKTEESTTEAPGGSSEPITVKTYSYITIDKCTFDENTGSSGGAVYFNDTEYTVNNSSFTKNTATNESYGGGAVYNTGTTGKISDVTFTGNTALRGGAVAIYTNSEVEFSHITATGNEATAEGGVIYANKCKVDLTKENIVFTDNKANHGGAVYATKAPLFDIKGAVIERNSAASNGGALYATGCTLNISGKNTVIRNNEAANHGGAIYLSYVTEADSSKTGGVLNIDGVSLTDNKALYGGAVSGRTNSVINLQNLTLSGNSAPDATSENKAGGGAIYTNNSVLNLSAVNITGNSSGYYGGAVFTEVAEVTINNGSVISGNNGGTGAAMYLTSGSSLVAENITVENNTSTANGIFYVSGKTFTFSGVTAKNNSAELNGGVIYVSGAADVDITDCVFTENTASNGGAVYHRSTNELTIGKTKFINNTASSNGGALDIVGSTVIASGENEFNGNEASGHGGAVYVTYISAEGDTEARFGKFTVTDGIFEENCAVGGGAVSIRSDCEAEFNGTVFKKNTVTGYEVKADGTGSPDGNAEGGGAVYVGYGKLTLNNVTALENEAYESVSAEDNTVVKSFGGAINAVKSQVSVTEGSYEGNKASVGGAFNIIDKSDAAFTGTVFQNNESVYVNKDYDNTVGGGAVNMNGGTLSLDKVTFTGNKSGYYGGALMAAGAKVDIFNNSVIENNEGSTGAALHFKSKSEVTLTDTEIKNNTSAYNGVLYANNSTVTLERVTATGNDAANGGVIFVSNANTVVNANNSTMYQNNASKGGVAYTENATVFFNTSTISENTASSGGAVYSNGGKINFNGGTVSSNTASNGGAVYGLENAAVNINDTLFNENSASRNGGAVYVSQSEAEITDAEFISNTAANHGGAVYLAGSLLNANGNNSFTSNTADNHGGAAYVVYFDAENEDGSTNRIPGVMTMNGGTFTENTALGGGAVSIRSNCEATFTDTVFTENSVTGFAGEADGDGEGGGAIYVGFGKLKLNNVTASGNTAVEGINTADNSVIKSFGGAVDSKDSEVVVTGGTFSGNSASSGGAFYQTSKSRLTVSGATLENNESVYQNTDYDSNVGGGAINAAGGSVILDGTTLKGNKTDYYGGAVLMSGTIAEIKGNSVIESSEGGTGAALYFKGSSDVTVNGAKVQNNTASANGVIYVNNCILDITGLEASGNESKNGGVIYTSNKNTVIEIKDSKFSANTATASGGAVYTENATVAFTGSEIVSNTAKNGGAVYSLGGKVSFSDSLVKENSSTSSGGAVYAGDGTLSLTDTAFSENSTSNHGGAVYLAGAVLTASGDNTFTSNSAKNHGGAVYVVYYDAEQADGSTNRVFSVLNMENGTFTDNTALGGGAVSIRSGCEATFTGTVFNGNTVDGFSDKADGDGEGGGAIYVGFGTLNLNNVTASGNTAEVSAPGEEGTVNYGFGGAVDSYNSTVNVTGGTFENNTAGVGGAFNVQGNSLKVDSASFKGNTSTANASSPLNSDFGGGTVRSKKAEITLTGVSIDGDKSNYYGGAVHSVNSTVTVNGNSEIKNVSGATGAALYFKDSSEALLENVSLKDNTSSYNGVIYISSGNITLKNVNASGNTAVSGGVLYVSSASATAEISGGVFSGNTANQGGALVVNAAKANISSAEFSGNSSKLGGAVYVVRGEITADNVEFINNSAVLTEDGKNGNGGAVSIAAGKVTASENVIFNGNSAENHGGAVYVSYGNNDDGTKTPGELYMNGGLFESNEAVSGGAVSSRTSCITEFTGTEFKNNSASSSSSDGGGGAVYTNDNKLTLSGVTVTGNSTGYYGGAVTGLNAEITVNNDSLFSGNKGITGAVFNFRGSSIVSLDKVTVRDNINEKGSGNVYITGSGSIDINALTASGNVNTNGGVIYISGSAVASITDSEFTGNEAKGIGGVVDHRSSGKLTVSGTDFTSNTAKNGGAMNLAGAGKVEIKSSTFESNAASVSGGALFITESADVKISEDTLFKGNTAPTAGAVHLDSGAKANISDSSFEANTATGGDGGAILVSDSSEEGKAATSLNANNVKFDGNTASSKGGAISTDTASPNLVINAVLCEFKGNKTLGAGGGAVEIQNGNCTSADGPTVNKLVFTNCKFTQNTSKTTGAAVEIRTSSCAKFDGIEATGNSAGSGKQNGGVFYVTSNHSRLYLTGTVTQSGNAAASTGKFAYLYNSSYSNPPRIYTSHSNTASWISDVGGNTTSITFDVTSMP